jgi:hypothetical protein
MKTRVVVKIKTHNLRSIFFFENSAVYEVMWKKHKQHCWFSIFHFTRMRHNVTLYAHCPPCYISDCTAPHLIFMEIKVSMDILHDGRIVSLCTLTMWSGDRIPLGGEIFRTRPDLPWVPPSLLYNGYRVSFPGIKRTGHGINHPPPLSPILKKE